jgi:type IV secretory pathway VirB3-like protein
MRTQLKEQPVIKAMNRAPMIAGVTYPYWGIMLLISTAGIVVLKSFTWFFAFFIILYFTGRLLAKYDVFFMDVIITKLTECPSTQNDDYWGCKSYEPW